MKTARYTDKFRGRYRTAVESEQPGYLARRMKAYARLERIKAAKQAKSNVEQLPQRRRG